MILRTGRFRHRQEEESAQTLGRNKFLKAIFILFLLGMIYGAVMVSVSSQESLDKMSFITGQFIDKRAQQSIFLTFFNSLYSSGILLAALFVLGFCAIGHPVSLFIPFFRGLGLGLSMGYLYQNDGLKGVVFCLLLIIPQAFFSTLSLILATRESVRFSNLFLSLLFPKKLEQSQAPHLLKLYLTKFGVLAGLIAVSALVDSVCTFLFAGFFVQ